MTDLPPGAHVFTWAGSRRPPGDGPWRTEPDKVLWVDAATGLDAMVHRNEEYGHLCGYVGVPPGHPWHGRGHADIPARVHGGITYANTCWEGPDPAEGICHVPRPGRPADVWWVGFDCAHDNDLSPTHVARLSERFPVLAHAHAHTHAHAAYRDLAYVIGQVAVLAGQAKAAADPDTATRTEAETWLANAVTPHCPGCGQLPGVAFDTQAICYTESCDRLMWDPRMTRVENLAEPPQ